MSAPLSEWTWVNLGKFWPAHKAITGENSQIAMYRNASEFWASYDAKLSGSRDKIDAVRGKLERDAQWSNVDGLGSPEPQAASTAFYSRIDAGRGSIQNWLNGGTSTVGQKFGDLARRLPEDSSVVEANRGVLLGAEKVVPGVVPGTIVTTNEPAKVADGDQWVRIPTSNVENIKRVVEDAERRHNELIGLFGQLKGDLDKLPDTEKWAGPTTTTAPPPANPTPGGPGAGPPAGPGGGPPAGPGGGPPAGPAPGQAPGAAPGGGPDASQPPSSTPDPGGEQPGATTDPGADSPSTMPPPSGPELAGVPDATMTPPPGSSTPVSPSTSTGLPGPTGANPATNPLSNPATNPGLSPMPLTGAPVSAAPTSSTGRPGSTVDGPRGTGAVPGTSGPASQEPAPRPRGGPAVTGSGTGAGHGGYPLVPPMYPPMGGMGGGGGSGIKPGEAEFTGGPVRRAGGRDSWRAGLRPQLLGRTGDADDEPQETPPATPRPGDEVLDEELWQVPGAAPAVPESKPRHGRSWGS